MRADNRVMKDISAYTRVSPTERGIQLEKLIASISDNAESMKVSPLF